MTQAIPGVPCKHKPQTMGYVQWHLWAERQTKKGIKQIWCDSCKRWLFPEELK